MHKFIKRQDGMTLVELIVAMAIFAIIAVMFISLFTSSILWIFGAGDRGEAYSTAQQDVESRLATGEAIENPDLVITFGADDYSIRGGLVESEQTVGQRSSQLETFMPLVPTLRINPQVQFEGYTNTTINVTGTNTNFSGGTYIEIFNSTGSTKIGSTINPTVSSGTSLSFNIHSNLLNSDYIVRVTTPISGEPNEVSRAKYVVEQPKFLAISDDAVYVSANGSSWTYRSGLPSFSPSLNAVANNGRSYTIVGDNGLVLYSTEKLGWSKRNASSEDLLDVAWSSGHGSFYASGASGRIHASPDASTWTIAYASSETYNINGVASTTFVSGDTVINAVGDEGRLIYRTSSLGWNELTIGSENLNAVASGNDIIVAVGDGGRILRSTNGIDWTDVSISSSNINDIAYNNAYGLFVAVGDNGLIRTSTTGSTWSSHNTGSNNLTGVFTRGTDYVAVGTNGTVLYSSNGTSWTSTSGISGVNLNSVAGR